MFLIKHNQVEMNYIFNEYGLGDHIGQFPAIDYLIRANPHLFLNIWIPGMTKVLAERCLMKTERLRIYDLTKDADLYDQHVPTRAHTLESMKNFACHTTEHAFLNICGRQGYPQVYNYLKIDTSDIDIPQIGNKYAIICTGYTAKVREMRPEVVNTIVDFLLSQNILPVFLGNKNKDGIVGDFNTSINYDKGLDLIDKTTLLQATKLINSAAFIVGLDNGLLHLAGTTEIPIIGGFTTVNPMHRMPYRHNQIGWNYYPVYLKHSELACSMCQSNWCVEFKHDFRKCYYNSEPLCTTRLTADRYIEQIKKVLI